MWSGYTGATALTKSYFGVGFRPHFMRVTYCSGSQSSLMSCTHTPLGSDPSCNALNEVGVRCIGMFTANITFSDINNDSILLVAPSIAGHCTPGDVRLFGGTNKYQGTVEVCFYGVWGTVCDSSYKKTNTIASVICRQLGFPSLG